ncbi:MAG: bifunctional diaminohydroxyphosphoribosylaminopyrimidine deaminase/5-amino-6-(5-phosphoribosylamino)uracil reductase RibD [Lentisphaerae bacterium]|nr:bifunctional diaminohydroxyphosphoribosylaminopyrimidine deaminase/5-amino-6-(5-phosphoribosylamino)uracil reductase RibD [Lentisphaerota bacterium]
MTLSADIRWMHEALALARRGEGFTRPNPPVGAVVVRGGHVVGRGYHVRAGGPHAEIGALRQAGRAAHGAVLYVTLEPCSTQGRTGACTTAILHAGVRRVVACLADPNPAHAGRGFDLLRHAGVTVTQGLLEAEGRALLAPFATWITRGTPLLSLKLAMTLDGRIADRRGQSRWISSPASRRRVQELRRTADAILVGAGTACADDPSLTNRTRPSAPLLRVVVDSTGRLPASARVLTDGHSERTIIATTSRCRASRVAAYRRAGAQVWVLAQQGGRVSLRALTRRLGQAGLLHVLCEGGGALAGSLLRAQLVDRLYVFVAPKILGAAGVPAVGGEGWSLDRAPGVVFEKAEQVGRDWLLTARVSRTQRRKA